VHQFDEAEADVLRQVARDVRVGLQATGAQGEDVARVGPVEGAGVTGACIGGVCRRGHGADQQQGTGDGGRPDSAAVHSVGHCSTPDSSGINSGKVRVIRAELPSAPVIEGQARNVSDFGLGILMGIA
jgi:hypothetical protein